MPSRGNDTTPTAALRRLAWLVDWAWWTVVLLLVASGAQAQAALRGGTQIGTRALAEYVPEGSIRPEVVQSNLTLVEVIKVEALRLTGDALATRPPVAPATFNFSLVNTGNVDTAYRLEVVDGAGSCPAARDFPLGGGTLHIDTNNNGAVDPTEPAVATTGWVNVAVGSAVGLLYRVAMPNVDDDEGCFTVTARSREQGVIAFASTVVSVGNHPSLSLTKSAAFATGYLVPGTSQIRYTLTATNTGAASAEPLQAIDAVVLRVDGAPRRLILIRDPIPAGTQYMSGSLQSSIPGAIRLFRLPGDSAMSFRTPEDASAVEVAIGLPAAIVPRGSAAMSFDVKLLPRSGVDLQQSIVNQARAQFGDGARTLDASSNLVVTPIAVDSIGIALSASTAQPQFGPDGVADGTAVVRMTARVRNYGEAPLYDVQVRHLLEGNGLYRLGTYTANALPGADQYTVVAGSLRVIQRSGSLSVAEVDSSFTGQPAHPRLLRAGARVGPEAEITLSFDLRIHVAGAEVKYTRAQVEAARVSGMGVAVTDISVDGPDPDPLGQGPQASTSWTPLIAPPLLSIAKAVSVPRRLGGGQFELDYRITVANTGSVVARGVRVVDHLACAFASPSIQSWSLVQPPTAKHGLLAVSSGFTGKIVGAATPCSATADPVTGVPVSESLSITDGTRDLAPGASESVSFTVRVQLDTTATARAEVVNQAWVAAISGLPGQAAIVAGQATAARSLLIDPQGIVYDSSSRAPLSGAVVTLRRTACDTGTAGAIVPAEVFDSEQYLFNSDGSVSLTTTADGTYQFFWRSPPVDQLCTYELSVVPPLGFAWPSTALPVQSTVFSACGAVVPDNAPPTASQTALYHHRFKSGRAGAAGAICEVIHNHVPLDPTAAGSLVLLKKESPFRTAEIGDFVDYKLTITNNSDRLVTGLSVSDHLPPGLAYLRGSTRLNGQLQADPTGAPGPALTFAAPAFALDTGASAELSYRVRIGVGAPTSGDAINVAQATLGLFRSNEARWRLRVRGGAFSDDAFAIGKVFLDCNGNRMQDGDGEPGVPGVRLFMETGVSVISDAHGRWSLYGLMPQTHVLKLDASTLPAGTTPTIVDSRNAGDAASRFLDLKKGELGRADFALGGCTAPGALDEVAKRRKAWEERDGRAELDAAVKMSLDANIARAELTNDRRGLSASGSTAGGEGGAVGAQDRPLIGLPQGGKLAGLGASAMPVAGPTIGSPIGVPANPSRLPTAAAASPGVLDPLPAPGGVPLENLVSGLKPDLAFLDLNDDDTVAARDVNVRIKGPWPGKLSLLVNGEAVPESRVGKRVTVEGQGLLAWEYIGVTLTPGANELVAQAIDEHGNARVTAKVRIIAPDDLGRLSLVVPVDGRSDPLRPVRIEVRLADKAGVPVTARTQITLLAERGEWLQGDPNTAEPGLQAMVAGGSAQFELRPPSEPGPVRLRVTSGAIAAEQDLLLLPAQLRMSGVGIVEGVLDLSGRGALSLGQTPASQAFEDELSEWAAGDDGKHSLRGRAAFYFKGTIRGDYLLTAAYDSDKRQQDRLFRDIKPNEYYPVYGDDSARSYDAHSTGRLYVRLDADRSYLLLGDFSTASSPEVRQLSQVNRTLSGVKHKVETDALRITSYASHDTVRQQVEEIAATGLSFYVLNGLGDIVPNTEKVELMVRSRTQPSLVLSTTPLARGADYTFEPLTRRLLLAEPVSSYDSAMNPQSIRVTYEVDAGGEKFLVAGVDAQVRMGESVQLGVVAAVDQNPANERQMVAVTGLARIGESTVVRAEVVQTDSDLSGQGRAAQAEVAYQDGPVRVQGKVQRTGTGFDNPSASAAAGRTEGTVTGELTLSPDTRVRAEGIYSATVDTGSGEQARQSVSVAVQHKLNPLMAVELGVSHGNVDATTAGRFDYGQVSGRDNSVNPGSPGSGGVIGEVRTTSETSLRGRLTTRIPDVPQAEAFVEAEQDIGSSDRHSVAVGGSYAITDRTRVYGRHELVTRDDVDTDSTGAAGKVQRATTILGVDAAYAEGGRIYNESRLGDAQGGVNATGVRHAIRLGEAWQLSGGIEHTRAIGSPDDGAIATGTSTAWAVAVDYALGSLRGHSSLEWRDGEDSDSRLFSYGLAYRLGADWTLIARGHATSTETAQGGLQTLVRQQLGMAWRPAAYNRVDGLFKYENRYEERRDPAGSDGALPLTGVAARSHIVTAVGNYQPAAGRTVSARYALRYTESDDAISDSSYWAQLVHGRYTHDIGSDWDAGVQAGLLFGKGGARRQTFGLEIGHQVVPNLWLSVGYNLLGLRDPELTGIDYTARGAYLRLRFKFDERGVTWLEPAHASGAAVTPHAPVPVAALVAQPASKSWRPGQPIPVPVLLHASELFEEAGRAARLSDSGRQLVSALADALAQHQVTLVDIVAGSGEMDVEQANAWLARAAALKQGLSAAGPRAIGMAFDTQPAPPFAGQVKPGGSVQIVVLASPPHGDGPRTAASAKQEPLKSTESQTASAPTNAAP